MKTTAATVPGRVMKRIRASGRGSVFTPSDFLTVAARPSVDQALSRLVKSGQLRRLARGLYDFPKLHPKFGPLSPTPNDVAQALARETGSQVQIAGARAANALGLSTQVPAQSTYLTDGPSRRVVLRKLVVDLRHASPKHLIAPGSPAGTVVQALRHVGPVRAADVAQIAARQLSAKDKKTLATAAIQAPAWMRPTLTSIASVAGIDKDGSPPLRRQMIGRSPKVTSQMHMNKRQGSNLMTLGRDLSNGRAPHDIDWRVYERVAACFEIDSADMDVSVTPNASLTGSISGVKRQIDILVDARWDEGVSRRIVFDAKLRKRKLDVKDVESFEGMMRDVRASRGVLVCSAGATKAAIQRAQQNIDIRVITTDESMELDHAAVDPCPHCATKSPPKAGLVFWDGQFPLPIGPAWAIIFTGKCDVCRSFAFWCWDCGEKVVVPDPETHECGCERTWFVEASEDEVLFVVRVDDGEVPLDRRPLR